MTPPDDEDLRDPAAAGWHLDKRLPAALLVTLLLQTSAIVWWAATTDSRIRHVEEALASASGTDARLARIEVRVENSNRSLDRLEDRLQRFEDRFAR